MTFKFDLEPPYGAKNDVDLRRWLTRLWNLLHGWFNKLYSLGFGLTLNTDDEVEVDTAVISIVPTGTGFPHVTAGVMDPAAKLVDTADVNDDQITFAKMQELNASTIMGRGTSGAGNPQELTLSSELGISGGTIIRIASNGITNAFLRDSVALSVIGRSVNSTGDPADISAAAGGSGVLRESGSTLGFATLVTANIGNSQITFAKIQNITTDRLVGRDTAGTGATEEIAVSGGIEFTGATAIRTSAFTGDVTKAAGGTALTIANDAVTYAKMQNVTASRILGRGDSGSGDPQELTADQGVDISGTVVIGPRRYTNTSVPAGNTIANTTTETAITDEYTIPANKAAAGVLIRIKMWGVYGSAFGAPTLRIKIKMGSTVMIDTTAFTVAGSITDGGWMFEGQLHVFTAGASGTVEAQGVVFMRSTAVIDITAFAPNTATITGIDTTVTEKITATFQWGTADAANTITVRLFSVEIE